MKPEQRKKETKYRLDAMWSSDAIAQAFFLEANDDVLITRINNGDESALFQFAIKHINILKRSIVSGGGGIEKELMNICFPVFFDEIKTFAKVHANKPLPELWEYSGKFTKSLKMDYGIAFSLIYEKHRIWEGYKITDKHIDFLNNLNAFLIKTEEEIVARAKIDLPMLEKRAKEIDSSTSDYEYFVDIDYLTEASNGDPVYTANHRFSLHNIEKNEWGLLCDGEDWRERGWLPTLETRCCYLMHELLYHASLAHFIFDINEIYIETKTWDQNFVSVKTGAWETVKWDSKN